MSTFKTPYPQADLATTTIQTLTGTNQVVIRHITPDDLPELEWDNDSARFRQLYADIYQSTRQGKALMWVADIRDMGVIGQLFVQLKGERTELANGVNRAYIYGFRIQPQYRRQGIGTTMMKAIEADLVRRRFEWITLNVGRQNDLARQLYQRLGYRIVAAEEGRWSYRDEEGGVHKVQEPAWRMEKHILTFS